MKRKNVIGHMTAPKLSAKSWIRRLDLLPRLLCILLAVVIWLLVVDLRSTANEDQPWASDAETVEIAE